MEFSNLITGVKVSQGLEASWHSAKSFELCLTLPRCEDIGMSLFCHSRCPVLWCGEKNCLVQALICTMRCMCVVPQQCWKSKRYAGITHSWRQISYCVSLELQCLTCLWQVCPHVFSTNCRFCKLDYINNRH